MSKSKMKFGINIYAWTMLEWDDTPCVKVRGQVERLDPNEFSKSSFSADVLFDFETSFYGNHIAMRPEPNSPVREGNGIDPLAFPSAWWKSRLDRDMLGDNEWNSLVAMRLNCHSVLRRGAREALELFCKADDFAENGAALCYEHPKLKPVADIFARLDTLSRFLLGLNFYGVKIIDGLLQDFQTYAPCQFDAEMVKSIWITSNMIRALPDGDYQSIAADIKPWHVKEPVNATA